MWFDALEIVFNCLTVAIQSERDIPDYVVDAYNKAYDIIENGDMEREE